MTAGTAQLDGDEIVLCGRRVRVYTPVVLFSDEQGYNAYRQGPYFAARDGVSDEASLRAKVDQIVLHYDTCGVSRRCFEVLQRRQLSAHFLLDLDGAIYQTLDLKERAWHATVCNARSVGVEIANIGSYAPDEPDPFAQWYAPDAQGRTRITIPAQLGDGGIRATGFVGRPARDGPVIGEIQGVPRRMYDFTPQQYRALGCLITALCALFPRIRRCHPRTTRKLDDAALAAYQGILGHYHIQAEKFDPGPALQWDQLLKR